MTDDDELCLCFHVPVRKVKQFIRSEKPKRTSQLSQCFGAGTGCGWCRPFLERLMKQECGEIDDITPDQYASMRKSYQDHA